MMLLAMSIVPAIFLHQVFATTIEDIQSQLSVVDDISGSAEPVDDSPTTIDPPLSETTETSTTTHVPDSSSPPLFPPPNTLTAPPQPPVVATAPLPPNPHILFDSIPPTCSSHGANPIPLFLWTEIPVGQLESSELEWRKFYESLYKYIMGNCINAQTTRLILRVINPNFPNERPMWTHPATSPLYTELISKLPDNIQLYMYPYLGEPDDTLAWSSQSSLGRPLYGVYSCVNKWNLGMEAMGSTRRFIGIVLDLEEEIEMNDRHVKKLKQKYPGIPYLGVSIGFDQVGLCYKLNKFVDHFYMQMYDFYMPGVIGLTKNALTSPFVIHRHDSGAMREWIKRVAFRDRDVQDLYRTLAKKMYIMWSGQNAGSANCMYPLNEKCGHSYDFGTWSAEKFNEFISIITTNHHSIGRVLFPKVAGHGLFEFDMMRKSWVF